MPLYLMLAKGDYDWDNEEKQKFRELGWGKIFWANPTIFVSFLLSDMVTFS